MHITKIATAGLIALFLGACTNSNMGTKETIGTLGGAALGGLAGAQIGSGKGQLAAVAAGTLLGAIVGKEIGRSLDKADQLFAERTAQQALEKNSHASWSNPQTGHSGAVTPLKTAYSEDGRLCRQYEQTITINGRTEQGKAWACRQPDGTWKIVK